MKKLCSCQHVDVRLIRSKRQWQKTQKRVSFNCSFGCGAHDWTVNFFVSSVTLIWPSLWTGRKEPMIYLSCSQPRNSYLTPPHAPPPSRPPCPPPRPQQAYPHPKSFMSILYHILTIFGPVCINYRSCFSQFCIIPRPQSVSISNFSWPNVYHSLAFSCPLCVILFSFFFLSVILVYAWEGED